MNGAVLPVPYMPCLHGMQQANVSLEEEELLVIKTDTVYGTLLRKTYFIEHN